MYTMYDFVSCVVEFMDGFEKSKSDEEVYYSCMMYSTCIVHIH